MDTESTRESDLKEESKRSQQIATKIRNFFSNLEDLPEKKYKNWKLGIFLAIIVDLIGIYWWLEFKVVALAILILLLTLFGILMAKNRPKEEEKPEKKEEKKEKIEEKEEDIEDSNPFGNFSIPSAEEYNKRLEKAFSM